MDNKLLADVKKNLIVDYNTDDELLNTLITSCVSYAESYQHKLAGYYTDNQITPTTRQAIIMLASHFYESRDGSTGGFFNDSIQASEQIWNTVNMLLRLDKDWSV